MPAVPTIRLTFLYPHLFRAARFGESSAQRAKLRCRKSSSSSKPPLAAATFSTSTSVKHAVFERHGTAVEPLPVPPAAAKTPPQGPTPVQPKPSNSASTNNKSATNQEKEVAPEPKNAEKAKTQEPAGNAAIPQAASSGSSSVNPQQVATEAKIQESGPMKAVLHTPPLESSHHPHLSTPPYVHHFDTYTLVKQLTDSGYTQAQAITAMKAIRVLLAQNMAVARDGLVSKSNVDNETYLFRAACSELSAEVKNNRRTADETTRQQRTQLQHEVDIVTQRMTQDLMTLKDDVKGMFNDRRMNVREEQRTMESAIQRLNLKIGVALNSDSRSDIEGLRWVLIRRSVLGILFMAVLTLGSLRYATYVKHERQKEMDEAARRAERLRRNVGREDHAPPVDAAEILAAN